MKHKNTGALIRLFNSSDDFAIELESEFIKLQKMLESGNLSNSEIFTDRFEKELRPRAAQLISELNNSTEDAGWMDRKIARALIRDITRQLKVLESIIEHKAGHTEAA